MLFNIKIEIRKFFIIVLGIISMLSMGTIYSWSVLRIPLEQSMGIGGMQSGFPFLVFLSLYSFSMPVAGRLIEKFKPSYVAIVGSLILAIGYTLAGYSHSLVQLILSYGVLGGIGVGTLYGVPIAMATRWFPKSRGVATGATLLGFGLSPLLTAPILSLLVEKYGVSEMFKVMGLVFMVLLPLVSLFFVDPASYSAAKSKDTQKVSVLGHRSFFKLWLLFFIISFTGLMSISISSPFAQEILDVSNSDAAMILSFFALFNGLGRLIFGYMIDKKGLRATVLLTLFLLIGASLLLSSIKPDQHGQFIISMCIVWGVFGGWLTIAPVSIVKFFGEQNAARNYGKLFTAYGFGAIAGVILVSKVKEVTGSYQAVYYVVLAMGVVGFLIIRKLFNHKK